MNQLKVKPNHVYVARNPCLGKSIIKIGCTADPIGREKSLSNASTPGKFKLEFVAYVGENNGRAIEKRLLDKFKDHCVGKEFFMLEVGRVSKEVRSIVGDDIVIYNPHVEKLSLGLRAEKDESQWRDNDDNGLIGHNVRRFRGKFGWTDGVVVAGDDGLYCIQYGAQDTEWVSINTLRRILV